MGTPTHAYREDGSLIWEREIDIYGSLRKGNNEFVPFLYQGQYVDRETGLCYNGFRYYSSETGMYLSQDPISIAGGLNLYAYVKDSNTWVDMFGLDCGKVKPKKGWQAYEKQIQDMYGGKLPQSHREYRAMVGGKQVNGTADHVVDINKW